MNIEQSDQQLAKIFFALSDPARVETVRLMKKAETGELTPTLLCELSRYDLSFSTRSYHGKILNEAGLTHIRKEGREKFCSLNKETFEQYLPGFLDTL